MTLEEAKNLSIGQIIYQVNDTNVDGSLRRWKVNGEVKTWKRKANQHRVRVPLKHGLWTYSYLTERNLGLFVTLDQQSQEEEGR